jgi:2-keto-4-pentenoate hydratase/2-oxohepta-3-ene-1,7-dioic acid hydratase in catechol pathway
MKLARLGDKNAEKPALVAADGSLRDLSAHVRDIDASSLDAGTLDRLASIDPMGLPEVPSSSRIGPCVARPCNFIAVGLNYSDHAAESGMPIPAEPILFTKAPNSICGPNDDVILPRGSTKLDWEIELGFVIGTRAYNVREERALDHVAGYCICNDVSERTWQIEGTGQWMKGKSAPTFGPLGPWLVTRDEISDSSTLDMALDVNGERMQSGTTGTMIFGVPFLVSFISRFVELLPGDVVVTGTPPGVGMGKKPQRFLKVGDEMRLTITGLGEQRQRVAEG